MVGKGAVRILQLFQPPDGGIPEHVRHLTAGLLSRGHEVVVAGPADAAIREAIGEAGARFVPVPLVGPVAALRKDLAARRAVRRLLGERRFDLLHTHGQKAGLLGRPAAVRAGVPALYSPHSFVYHTQLRRPRPGARLRYRVNLAVERALGRRTAALVACAEAERDTAVGDGVIAPERVHVVLYGVDPDPSVPPHPRLADFRGDGPLLGFVATLRDQKGLPTLLDALDLLAERGESPRFAIVGNGPLRNEVQRRVASGPLARDTLLLPFEGRVEPYLQALDVFVLPSYWEGMPIALLEAMAMGVPAVASAVDGTPEAVTEGVTGHLIPARDPVALADALARIAGDAPGRARMGEAARLKARRRFGIPRMVEEMEALYRSVSGAS
jgi:glycosyltransferase involved in cell wall biosynthesis